MLPFSKKTGAMRRETRQMCGFAPADGKICAECADSQGKTRPGARISRNSRHIGTFFTTEPQETRIRCISRHGNAPQRGTRRRMTGRQETRGQTPGLHATSKSPELDRPRWKLRESPAQLSPATRKESSGAREDSKQGSGSMRASPFERPYLKKAVPIGHPTDAQKRRAPVGVPLVTVANTGASVLR